MLQKEQHHCGGGREHHQLGPISHLWRAGKKDLWHSKPYSCAVPLIFWSRGSACQPTTIFWGCACVFQGYGDHKPKSSTAAQEVKTLDGIYTEQVSRDPNTFVSPAVAGTVSSSSHPWVLPPVQCFQLCNAPTHELVPPIHCSCPCDIGTLQCCHSWNAVTHDMLSPLCCARSCNALIHAVLPPIGC